jgi:hypothetical protein
MDEKTLCELLRRKRDASTRTNAEWAAVDQASWECERESERALNELAEQPEETDFDQQDIDFRDFLSTIDSSSTLQDWLDIVAASVSAMEAADRELSCECCSEHPADDDNPGD